MPPPDVRSAEAMLKAYQEKGPSGITITIEEWLRQTDLGALSRRTDEMRAIDDALRAYHLTPDNKDGAFVRLKMAFDNWIRFQQRQGKNWKLSDRNKNGAITRLFDQITLVEAGRSVANMKDAKGWEGRQAILQAERDALERLFKERSMIFKNTSDTKQAVRAIASPAARYGLATGKIVTSGIQPVSPNNVAGACQQILGKAPPEELFHMLGASFGQFCTAASTILGAAVSPAKLLADIVKFGLAASARYSGASARYMFRPGAPDAALNAVLQMIDDELKAIAWDAAKQAGSIVGSAFAAGPIVSIATSLVDVMINLKLYCGMLDEIKAANQMLAQKTWGLELFNASPVLGCYFLLMADTSVWLNFSVHDIGSPGWMDTVEAMRKRAEPIREKARELVRSSKITLSGTEGFNGLEWEPSWRNNKLSYLAATASGGGLIGSIKQSITGGGLQHPQVDKSRIVGVSGP